jgi:hypothetical protein
MGKRGTAISQNEMSHILDVIEDILPIGGAEWELVERRHNAAFPDKMRNKDTIKKKFNTLKDTQPSTGDPHIPEDVQRAKDIFQDLLSKIRGDDGEDDDEDKKEDDADDDDDDDNKPIMELAKGGDESDDSISIESSNQNKKRKATNTSTDSATKKKEKESGGSVKSFSSSEKKRKEPVFQVPVSRPGTKRSSFNAMDDSMDKYFKFLVTQHQMERDEKREDERLRRIQMDAQQQQFQQMMQVMMMGIMSNNNPPASNPSVNHPASNPSVNVASFHSPVHPQVLMRSEAIPVSVTICSELFESASCNEEYEEKEKGN